MKIKNSILLFVFFCSLNISAQIVRPGVTLHRNWSPSTEQNILGSVESSPLNALCGYTINPSSHLKTGYLSMFDLSTEDTIKYTPYISDNENVFYSVAVSDGHFNSSTGMQPVVCAGYEVDPVYGKDILLNYSDIQVSNPIKGTNRSIINDLYDQEARYIRQSSYGSYYFWACGYSELSAGNKDCWIANVYANGGATIQSDTVFGGSGEDVLNSFAYNMNGAILFTGYTTSSPALGKDIKSVLFMQGSNTIMVDTSFKITGDQELYDTYFNSLTYTMLSVGYSDTTGTNKDFFVVCFNQLNGDTSWTKTFGTPYNDEAKSIKMWNGGMGFYYVVSGYTTSPDGDKDNYVALLDMSGNLISERIFGKPGVDDCINTSFTDNCQYFLFGNEGNAQTFNECVAYNYNLNVSNVTCNGMGDGKIDFIDESSLLFGNITNIELYDSSNYIGSGYNYTSLQPDTFLLQFNYSFGAKSGCFMQDTIIITQPDSLKATISTIDPDCMGNPGRVIISPYGGTPPYSIDWVVQQGGDTLFTSLLGEGSVSVTDDSSCIANFSYQMNYHSLPSIYGAGLTLTDSIQYNHGKAILYKVGYTGSAAELDSITSYVIDTNNLYYFSNLQTGDYKVLIQIDSTSFYQDYLDSYYSLNDTVITWQMGDTLSVTCDDTVKADVNMFKMIPMVSGIGSISGYIYIFTNTKAVGEPVPGAEILIEQEPNDVPVQCVYTGNNGYYEANGLEVGNEYTMAVEIPGYPMINTYTSIPFTTSDTVYEYMNFYVDTTIDGGIMADTLQTPVYSFTNEVFNMSVYPNPFNSNISFDFNLPHDAFIKAEILNMSGEPVFNVVNEKRTKGKTEVRWEPQATIPSGIYFLRVKVENQVLIKKIIFTK
jgi:hypothetical protein